MGSGMFDGLVNVIIALLIVAFLCGAAMMWALPKLWHLIKPLIHGWTA